VLDLKTFIELKNRTYLGLLENATVHGSPDKLRVLWKQVTCDDDNVALLVDYYATALCKCGAILDAEALLRQAIQRCWDTRLVIRYGMLRTRNDMALQLLTNAERWLVQHNNDPYLLLTLGRLSKYCKHLEKARGYLEMSVKLMPTPAAYKELGELAEALQELQYASQCFHAGLEIITDNSWTVGSA
jgi:HemY protein